MKTRLSIILLIVILTITGYVNAAVASVQAPTAITTEESKFVVKLSITEKISAIQFTVKYDEEILEFDNVVGHGGKAINNSQAGEAVVAFISTTESDAPYSIIFKALEMNKKTKIKIEDIKVVVTDTSIETGIREEDLANVSLEVKASELTQTEKLDVEEEQEGETSAEQQLLDETKKLEIPRPDPNAKKSSNIKVNEIVIYSIIGIVGIVVIVIIIKFAKRKKQK